MITGVYAVFDMKADMYNVPFFMARDGMAVRAFHDLVGDSNSMPGRHPGDFKLCRIGAFDDESGVLEPEAVKTLCIGSDCLDKDTAVNQLRKISGE